MKKRFISIFALLMLLASCGGSTNNDSTQTDTDPTPINVDPDTDYNEDPSEKITDDDSEYESPIDGSSISEIFANESQVAKTTEEDIFSQEDGEIKNAGVYHLKGEYQDLIITAKKGTEIFIYFDGVTITSSTGIAFGSEKNITLHLILVDGTENIISNTSTEEANAFHVKGDVVISGSGSLKVTSSSKNAIKASKGLYICENVKITAEGLNHAIGAQNFASQKATLVLSAKEKDGINTECDGEIDTFTVEQGYVHLEDTDLTIDSYGDGIQAASYLYISGGKTNITTHGEFIAYSADLITSGEYAKDDFKFKKSGNTYVRVATDEVRNLSGMYALVSSTKGLKVAGIEYEDENGDTQEVTTGDYLIEIAHLAEVTINSTDDAIHSNYGDVTLNNSNFTLDSFDDGVHADYDLTIDDCSITINSSYEGLEGGSVTVNGENTNIVTVSSDDGINAASDYVKTNNITINNGYLRVYASGDGLDANTALYLNGGVVIVEGPGSNNGSLDAENIYFKGGLVFACSTNGMLERMSASQPTFVYTGTSVKSGTQVSITDENSNSLFTYTLRQSCSQLIFSSGDMKIGSKYSIVTGTSTVVATISMTSNLTKVGGSSQGGGNQPGGPGGRF